MTASHNHYKRHSLSETVIQLQFHGKRDSAIILSTTVPLGHTTVAMHHLAEYPIVLNSIFLPQ